MFIEWLTDWMNEMQHCFLLRDPGQKILQGLTIWHLALQLHPAFSKPALAVFPFLLLCVPECWSHSMLWILNSKSLASVCPAREACWKYYSQGSLLSCRTPDLQFSWHISVSVATMPALMSWINHHDTVYWSLTLWLVWCWALHVFFFLLILFSSQGLSLSLFSRKGNWDSERCGELPKVKG